MGEVDLVVRLRDHNRSFNCVSEEGRECWRCDAADEIERLRKRDEESMRRAEARRQEIKRTRKGFRKCEAERDRLRDENRRLHDEFERERGDAKRWCAEEVAAERKRLAALRTGGGERCVTDDATKERVAGVASAGEKSSVADSSIYRPVIY